MNRKVFSAIIILMSIIGVSNASAQFRYGPTASVSYTDLSFEQNLMSVDKNLGFSAGIMGEMMFPGIGFGIDFGLLYDMRGATMHLGERKMWEEQGLGTERSYLHYVSITIHLRFKYTKFNGFEDKLAPFVYAGPVIGILAGHNRVSCMNYAAGEIGIEGGIGAEIMRKWQVSVSYTHGLTYALKDKSLTDFTAKNIAWSLRVAYLF